MAKYLIVAGVVSAPEHAFYKGEEVTAEALGVGPDRIKHLLAQEAIEEVAEEKPATPPQTPVPPVPPADPVVTAVGADTATALRAAGFLTTDAINTADDAELLKVPTMTDAKLKKLRVATRGLAQ